MISKTHSQLSDLIGRYALFFMVLSFGLTFVERLLTAPTIYTLYKTLRLIYPEVILENIYIFVNGHLFEISSICMMGAVYWFLLLLVLATANLRLSTRVLSIALAWLAVFVFNIIRMILLISIVNSSYFDSSHWIFENIIAAIVLVLIWWAIVRLYHIESVPFYSDLKYIQSITPPPKKRRPISPAT